MRQWFCRVGFPVSARYYYLVIKSCRMEDQLQEGTGEGHLRQMVSSPSMKNITRDHIKNLLIPLPSLGEQKLIVTFTRSLVQYLIYYSYE